MILEGKPAEADRLYDQGESHRETDTAQDPDARLSPVHSHPNQGGQDRRVGRHHQLVREPPLEAEALYDRFVAMLRERSLAVETGRFGAMMDVELVNDGPVTLILEKA